MLLDFGAEREEDCVTGRLEAQFFYLAHFGGITQGLQIDPSGLLSVASNESNMGTAQVELMAPATTFVKAQSFKERHLCKAQSESTDIAEIVESLSKFTFTVPVQAVQEEKEEEREYMAKCECCGLLEECTPAYVSRVKAIFCNRLVCGLCAEAVKEERFRMGPKTAMEDALTAHMKICYKFNTFTRQDPAADLAMAMRQILRRSIELGATPKPKGRLWQRAGLSRSETFSTRSQRKSLS